MDNWKGYKSPFRRPGHIYSKIINCQVDINANNVLIPNPDIYHTGGHKRFMIPMTRIDSYKFSFFPSAIKIWNSLSQHVINLTEIERFKHNLDTI